MPPWTAHLLYALAWASFGAGHSLLAARPARAWLQARTGRAYRLVYNAIAVVHIALVVLVGHLLLDGQLPFALPAGLPWGMAAVAVTGVVLMLWCLRFYDTGLLLGTRQWREGLTVDDEPLTLTGPHRYVRHPLYAAAFLILWGRAVDPLGLATAFWGSLYLLIGTACEERKLLAHFGATYADYRARVPAFVPWRGRVL